MTDPWTLNWCRPGKAVRSQTRNLVELLSLARHRGTYYLFMEDDFR
jgi:hypothetical protein